MQGLPRSGCAQGWWLCFVTMHAFKEDINFNLERILAAMHIRGASVIALKIGRLAANMPTSVKRYIALTRGRTTET